MIKGFIMDSFRVNTNSASLHAQYNTNQNNKLMDESLVKLSSGLRINSASDDASGMMVADSLRSQALTLTQSIENANIGSSIMQIAQQAMDEQVKIVDSIKVKATQAAQDGQSTVTRAELQSEISTLISELDSIASTTSYNGKSLLSGSFTNKEFQIGAYSNEDIMASIGATSSDKLGNTRFETSSNITASATISLSFSNVNGVNNITLESVILSTSAGTGLGVLSESINKNSDMLGGIKASYSVLSTGSAEVSSGTMSGLIINGVAIGVSDVQKADSDGALISAINEYSSSTGVTASLDRGILELNSADGRAIKISGTNLNSILHLGTASSDVDFNGGRLTLTKIGAADIELSDLNSTAFSTAINSTNINQATFSLRDITGGISSSIAEAMGFYANDNVTKSDEGAGVSTLKGAMATMNIADSARVRLDQIRAGIGAIQNQFSSSIDNISQTQINVLDAESQIRDVDFAAESAKFSKYNILAQSGSFAIAQANVSQQSVLKLLDVSNQG
jgi:flagellin